MPDAGVQVPELARLNQGFLSRFHNMHVTLEAQAEFDLMMHVRSDIGQTAHGKLEIGAAVLDQFIGVCHIIPPIKHMVPDDRKLVT